MWWCFGCVGQFQAVSASGSKRPDTAPSTAQHCLQLCREALGSPIPPSAVLRIRRHALGIVGRSAAGRGHR
eukprot:7127801-Alexandrium_andersonii.AAC.1